MSERTKNVLIVVLAALLVFSFTVGQGRVSVWDDPEIYGSGQFVGRGMIVMTSARNAVVGYLQAVETEDGERFVVIGSGRSNDAQDLEELLVGFNAASGEPIIEVLPNGEVHINGSLFVNGQMVSAGSPGTRTHSARFAGRDVRSMVEAKVGLCAESRPANSN